MLLKTNKKGFTLIELLVVVAIISLLSSIVLASLGSARTKARDARRLADLRQIDTAFALYFSDNGAYPGGSTTYYWISDNNYPGTSGYPPCATSGGLQGYLANVCNAKDPQGNPYAYVVLSGNQGYRLGARFEQTSTQGIPFVWDGGTVASWYERK